jgi:hypothetical protein
VGYRCEPVRLPPAGSDDPSGWSPDACATPPA